LLSQKLATIIRNVSVKLNLKECQVHDYDHQKIERLFEELEFKSLIKKLPGQKKEEEKKQKEKEDKNKQIAISMKVALVHDYLIDFGGAERVLLALCEIWPDAPVYTAITDKRNGHSLEILFQTEY